MSRGEFGPIITANRLRLSVCCDRPFEHAGNAPAGEARGDLQCQTLPSETVDHAQDAETLSGGGDIAGEVQSPLLVGRRLHRPRLQRPPQMLASGPPASPLGQARDTRAAPSCGSLPSPCAGTNADADSQSADAPAQVRAAVPESGCHLSGFDTGRLISAPPSARRRGARWTGTHPASAALPIAALRAQGVFSDHRLKHVLIQA